jgi:PAS domain-containing protein
MEADETDGVSQSAEELEALLLAPVIGATPAADEESRRIQDRLRRRETALRAVLEGLPDATVAASRDGRIVFATSAPPSCSATAPRS